MWKHYGTNKHTKHGLEMDTSKKHFTLIKLYSKQELVKINVLCCYYVVKKELPNLTRDRLGLQVVSYSRASKSLKIVKTNTTCIFVRINSLLLLLLLLLTPTCTNGITERTNLYLQIYNNLQAISPCALLHFILRCRKCPRSLISLFGKEVE